MHIVFRVDSSTIIGHGHVMRCLTLAQALLRAFKTHQQVEKLFIVFICRSNKGNINQRIIDSGFHLIELPASSQTISADNTNSWLGTSYQEDALRCIEQIKTLTDISLLVVDHYAIDHHWQSLIKPYCQKMFVIDDLANRQHVCDYLLDQTYLRNCSDYNALIPEHSAMLLGQQYILLRDEFSALKASATRRRQVYMTANNSSTCNILITMGGSDPENLSKKALLAIKKLIQQEIEVTTNVVISSKSKHLNALKQFCQSNTWATLIVDSKNMAELMLTADIAIGACGGTAWERCALGLPCLTTINAENQQLIADNLTTKGAIINLGWHQDVTIDSMSYAIKSLQGNTDKYKKMVSACFDVCDGTGTQKVAQFIMTETLNTPQKQIYADTNNVKFREASIDDCELTFHWQSNKKTRQYFNNPETPSWQEHKQWYQDCLKDKNRTLIILQDQYSNNIGLLRLDKQITNQCTINCYEVSLIIAPRYQGNGFSVLALNSLIKRNENSKYIANIDPKNTASKKAFIKAGFTQFSSTTYQLTVANFKVST